MAPHGTLRTALVGLLIVSAALVAAMPMANDGTPAPTGVTPPEVMGDDAPRTTAFDDPVVNPQTGVRPLLVVLLEFTDLTHDPVLTPAFIQNQIFGPRPSMNDYWIEQSYGQFRFSDQGSWTWVTAWNDPATASADESTRAYWNTAPDPTYGGGTFQRWGLKSLDQAGYNFAPLDFNSDGTINFGQEVAYIVIDANNVGSFSGAMRGMPPGLTLDGKTVAGVSCGVSSGTPWITLYAHELAHQSSWGGAWFLTDYYGIQPQNIGQFSLMGFSGFGSSPNVSPNGPHHLDPLSKMKLGWYAGTAITADGYYNIANAETNPLAYVLYDPAHGKGEYFMVENRWKGTSYDNTDALIGALPAPFAYQGAAADIPDEGLLIWHVDEARDWNGTATGGFAKVDLIRRGGSDATAAFDGSEGAYYDFWDGSATENARWNDGTNSKTGVWCVSGKAATMRAFLDVPGPGVLVCSASLGTSAVPGSAGTVSVPIRNTGDASDTFSISVLGPGDVVATVPAPVTVTSKTQTTVSVSFTPVRACTNSPGTRSLTIVVTSTLNPGVSDSVAATLTVLSYGDPQATVAAVDDDVEPGQTGSFDVDVLNNGNAFDTLTFTFTGTDFGSTYRALPTAIPTAWTSFAPASPSAPACGTTASVLSIAVPLD